MRNAVACTQATACPSLIRRSAVSSSPTTIAQAPSEDGQVSSKRMGSHSMGEDITFSTVISG
ncbi:Uncharacterised protein [Mycobacteroides abscessus subsp. abscessus]|nr:Uncharacterised protein [Mycobacteroides abscessus subsp. abscessus]